MKQPMNFAEALGKVRKALTDLQAGTPLPVHTDAGFVEFANAVAVMAHASRRNKQFQKIGSANILMMAEHVIRENDKAKLLAKE